MNNFIPIAINDDPHRDYSEWWIDFIYKELPDLSWDTAREYFLKYYNVKIEADESYHQPRLVFSTSEDALAFRIKYVYG